MKRPDMKAMDARWIEAVRDLWVEDEPINIDQLEAQWELKPLETSGGVPYGAERGSLLCCLTGFTDGTSLHPAVPTSFLR